MTTDLNSIHSPADYKHFSISELGKLCYELRAALIKKLAAHGGHVGPNLGVVEATVALHYVFDAPEDRLVFDVSHQTYVHKMLTGRIQAFTDPDHYDDVTGYTCPDESEYDLFEVGHTSTSISLATGLAKARDLMGGTQNVVAFIGDASLGGGQALEGLDYAPELKSNFIVVLNDNQMSIAENHGALFSHLKELRETNGTAQNNIFKALGYEYIYVRDGNDLSDLIRAFRAAKDADHAVLVHINTMKGMGLPAAEKDKETFHYHGPFDILTGASGDTPAQGYDDIFALHMLEQMHSRPEIVALTAGTPGAYGWYPERRRLAGKQFVDVGICEQDEVGMAAGLAKGGARPVVGFVSSFMQRAYDQLSQDVAINRLPVTVVIFYSGIFGMNDATHLGWFDISFALHIPNWIYLCPANAEDYVAMIDWATGQSEHPVFVRTPGGPVRHTVKPVNPDIMKWEILRRGDGDTAIIGAGSMLATAMDAADIMEKDGRKPTVIYPRCLSHLDPEVMSELRNYKRVITIEDGIADGGFGQTVAAALSPYGVTVNVLGLKKEFLDKYDAAALLQANGMTATQIAAI